MTPEDWDNEFDAGRQRALETAFGKMDDTVTHAVVPFQFGYDAGGRAHVYHFSNWKPGVLSVTASLIGEPDQKSNVLGNYELAIHEPAHQSWGASIISALAYYTLDAALEPFHTMDLPRQPNSEICGFIFDSLAEFEVAGTHCGVLLCIGITEAELERARREGGATVLNRLKSHCIHPTTDLGRRSVEPPVRSGFLSRLIKR